MSRSVIVAAIMAESDMQFRRQSELMTCNSLEVSDGDGDDHIAAFGRYTGEISDPAARELTAIRVEYLCPRTRASVA